MAGNQFIIDENGGVVASVDGLGNALFAGLQKASLHITSAQLLALHTAPLTVVAAPGAGLIIVPIVAILKNTFGTVAYVSAGGGTNLDLYWHAITAGHQAGVLIESAFTNTVSTYFITGGPFSGPNPGIPVADAVNQPILLGQTVANMTAGDGSADLALYFQILPAL